ncbi:hypothetical protein Celaphus_00008807 [Cervus elaphus hippelaphus]|uniref:Uncharacterized protein n=1 Tax=Cervus elaphus hippelaphus TaxID=46360 RepID=A0A212CPL6_CEREH|nr:hypothetical protein Celaphus_00008807 [Cervus elaphus hippelaphus]
MRVPHGSRGSEGTCQRDRLPASEQPGPRAPSQQLVRRPCCRPEPVSWAEALPPTSAFFSLLPSSF